MNNLISSLLKPPTSHPLKKKTYSGYRRLSRHSMLVRTNDILTGTSSCNPSYNPKWTVETRLKQSSENEVNKLSYFYISLKALSEVKFLLRFCGLWHHVDKHVLTPCTLQMEIRIYSKRWQPLNRRPQRNRSYSMQLKLSLRYCFVTASRYILHVSVQKSTYQHSRSYAVSLLSPTMNQTSNPCGKTTGIRAEKDLNKYGLNNSQWRRTEHNI